MKEILGDKVEEAIVNDRTVDSLRVLAMSERDSSTDTERIMKAEAPRDNSRYTASEYGGSANLKRIAQQPSGSQQQRQSTRQQREKERKKERKGEGERGRSEQEGKGREERESVRKGERGKEEGTLRKKSASRLRRM